ncbi:MAG: glycosyl hydrolase family 18 protein [bacterium]
MKIFITFISFIAIIATIYALIPPTTPYSAGSVNQVPMILGITNTQPYRVLGFLPHWNLKKVSSTALQSITDLAYFALEIDGKGNLITKVNSREEHPGWTNFKRFQKDSRFATIPLTLTIQMLDNTEIENLLNNKINRKNAINTILDLTTTYSLHGINLDLEPTGIVPISTRENFTLFIEELSQSMSFRHLSGLEVSVDIYPTLVGKQRLWDLPRLAPYVTYFVIMGYDYHYRGSDTAGPVAPLRGATTFFNDDLTTNLGEISRILAPNKIILGIPFYGYRWVTTTTDKYSPTIGSGVTAPLSDISALLLANPDDIRWDRDSFTPYLIIDNGNKISQIYFENELSLGLKLDLIKSSTYQGIAIWALGYEGDNLSLWQTIFNKLRN